MSGNDVLGNCDDDLELLRQAALSSLLKKKALPATTNAVFYRPSANSNLISIQPVETVLKEPEEASPQSTESENEIIIAEGLSVSSDDCDEIVEEVLVSEGEDDENNNQQENESDGEDAVSVASKDSFDEILNSIEQEISGVKKKPADEPKRRKEPAIPVDKPAKLEEKSRPNSRNSHKAKSRSPHYHSSGGRRLEVAQHRSDRRNNFSSRRERDFRSRSRSPLRKITRSRSKSRSGHSNSPYLTELRRPRSPIDRRRSRYRSRSPPPSDRRYRSRSRSPTYQKHKKDDNKGTEMLTKLNSPHSPHSKTRSGSDARTRSSSPLRRRRDVTRSSGSSKGKDERDKAGRNSHKSKPKRSPSPIVDTRHLTDKERELFEKRKRKFQSSGASLSGKVVLKHSTEFSKASNSTKKIKMTDGTNSEEDKFRKLERKLKLSSRLGRKVSDDDEPTEAAEHKSEESSCEGGNITVQVHQDVSPNKEEVEAVEDSSNSNQPKLVDANKEDLRTKLQNKRVGRLFTAALKDTFHSSDDTGSGNNEKSRRKLVPMNQ